jgi:hypothetical protein
MRKARRGARRGGRKGISEVPMVRKLTVFLLFCGLAGGAPAGTALAAAQHDVAPARAAQLPALGANRRGGSLEFAQYDTRLDHSGIDTSRDKSGLDAELDRTGIDTRLDQSGIDTSVDKSGVDTEFDQTGIDNPANAIRQTPLAGGKAVSAPPAPPSAIRGSSGVTIINAPAEGAAIESSTGPTIMHAPGAAQE